MNFDWVDGPVSFLVMLGICAVIVGSIAGVIHQSVLAAVFFAVVWFSGMALFFWLLVATGQLSF